VVVQLGFLARFPIRSRPSSSSSLAIFDPAGGGKRRAIRTSKEIEDGTTTKDDCQIALVLNNKLGDRRNSGTLAQLCFVSEERAEPVILVRRSTNCVYHRK